MFLLSLTHSLDKDFAGIDLSLKSILHCWKIGQNLIDHYPVLFDFFD